MSRIHFNPPPPNGGQMQSSSSENNPDFLGLPPSSEPSESNESSEDNETDFLGRRPSREPSESNESSEDTETDFLGRRPSREPSESNESSEDTETDFLGRRPSREPSESFSDQSNRGNQGTVTVERPSRPKRPQGPPLPKYPIRRNYKPFLKNIIRLQRGHNLLIPRLPFQRLVREIMHEINREIRLQSTTLEALRESTEMFMVSVLEDAYVICRHCKRVTVTDKHIKLLAAVDHTRQPLMYENIKF
ncbi:histone H3-like 1 [Contarinia nasturtii]|uniref:histone H3-like 1 n=1 Tax=Contarinia nasturtii TaxID=265458 RepID=UPI0012D47F13|nr:histone H3-like 1 [Contarinia nasturtii]